MLGLFLGRSVKDVRYSVGNSISSSSLIGLEGGMPSLTGADSPLNRSPKSLFEWLSWELCGRASGEGVAVGEGWLSFAAKDFARE
jgi:hypothetical protein